MGPKVSGGLTGKQELGFGILQGILKEISSMEFNEPCVMSDINSRLPEHALRWLNAAEPAGEDSAEAAASSR